MKRNDCEKIKFREKFAIFANKLCENFAKINAKVSRKIMRKFCEKMIRQFRERNGNHAKMIKISQNNM